MDVIRCDEQEYLVWKWRPSGQSQFNQKKTPFVGEVACELKTVRVVVLFYKQKDGTIQDFIEGPHDQTLKKQQTFLFSQV